MGKGLSPLQRDILTIALKNRDEQVANKWVRTTDAYYAEVLHLHFGWPFNKVHWLLASKSDAEILNCVRNESPSAQFFSKEQIGAAKYNADMAALSRSMVRLEKRGLVKCMTGANSRWSGAILTDAGVIAARKL